MSDSTEDVKTLPKSLQAAMESLKGETKPQQQRPDPLDGIKVKPPKLGKTIDPQKNLIVEVPELLHKWVEYEAYRRRMEGLPNCRMREIVKTALLEWMGKNAA